MSDGFADVLKRRAGLCVRCQRTCFNWLDALGQSVPMCTPCIRRVGNVADVLRKGFADE